MGRYYFELTDENYNDLGAFIPDGSSKLAAIGKAKKWMQEHRVRRAILAVSSMKTDNLLDVIDIPPFVQDNPRRPFSVHTQSADLEQTKQSGLGYMKTSLKVICLESETSEFHLWPVLCTPEVQKQSVLRKHHKLAEDVLHEPCQQKFPGLRALHSVHVHHLVRNDEGQWLCQYCGQSFPSTPEGGLDKEQLLREMILR